jgi:hypothetical protein
LCAPWNRAASTASWGQRTVDGEWGRFLRGFLTQNGGLKYTCEALQVRLIVAMVNIDIKGCDDVLAVRGG